MRYLFVLLLVFASLVAVSAQETLEPVILNKLWEHDLLPDIKETALVTELGIDDINDDGYAEAYAVTSGLASSSNAAQKNHITVFWRNGSVMWEYGIDDRVKDVIVYDIDNDRRKEFIVTTGETLNKVQRGTIRIVSSDGVLMRKYDSTAIINSMYLGDLEGDKYYEIAAGSERKIYLFRTYGEEVFHYPPKGLMNLSVDAIYIYDLNNDKRGEIIAGAEKLYYLGPKGTLAGSIDIEREIPYANKGIKFIDVAKFISASPETIAVTKSNNIIAVSFNRTSSSTDGPVFEELGVDWSVNLNCRVNDMVINNINGDAFDDILIACSNNKIYALNQNGAVTWAYPLDGEPMSIYVKDIDGDGADDILAALSSGSIYALDMTGEFKWRQRAGSPLTAISAGDMDGNNLNEIAVTTGTPSIKVFGINETYTFRRRADTLYVLGQDTYLSGKSKVALEHFKEAKKMYMKLGYEKGVIDSQAFITKIENEENSKYREEADAFYTKAQEYYAVNDFANAKTFVEKAQERYTEFNDNEGIVKCELLKLQIEKLMGEIKPTIPPQDTTTSTTLPAEEGGIGLYVYVLIGFVILLIIGAAVAKSKAKGGFQDSLEGSEDILDKDMKEMEDEMGKGDGGAKT
jgi:hypothetical protein